MAKTTREPRGIEHLADRAQEWSVCRRIADGLLLSLLEDAADYEQHKSEEADWLARCLGIVAEDIAGLSAEYGLRREHVEAHIAALVTEQVATEADSGAEEAPE